MIGDDDDAPTRGNVTAVEFSQSYVKVEKTQYGVDEIKASEFRVFPLELLESRLKEQKPQELANNSGGSFTTSHEVRVVVGENLLEVQHV